jgi:hypothetical protein
VKSIARKPISKRIGLSALWPNPIYCIFIETLQVKKIFLIVCLAITSCSSHAQMITGRWESMFVAGIQVIADRALITCFSIAKPVQFRNMDNWKKHFLRKHCGSWATGSKKM